MEVGIIGAGTMGNGIAQIAATNGHKTYLFDVNKDNLDTAKAKLEKITARLVEKGRLEEPKRKEILDRIIYSTELKEAKDCGLIIEAIIENIDIKKTLFSQLDKIVGTDCILASNTSSLSIASIAGALDKSERFLGIHYFNPAPLMPLVEIIPSFITDSEITAKAKSITDSWGKTTVIAKDTPGFIVNRVARPFYGEAMRIAEEQIADIPTIDAAMKEIGGFRMGPFELTDFIGHDVNYKVTESVWESFYYDQRFKPSLLQKRLVEAGFLGLKSNRGFYDYRENAEKPTAKDDNDLKQLVFDRIIAMLINEACDALNLGIATAEDIELAMVKGLNYPKGLLSWGDEIGADVILGRLQYLYDLYKEDRYRPNILLKQRVDKGNRLNQD